MLRNALVCTSHTLAKLQCMQKLSENTIRRMYFVSKLNDKLSTVETKERVKYFTTTVPNAQKEEVEVSFVKADGTRIKTIGKSGDSLLDVVVNNSIDLEGFGACEGTLTCSTCHLIFNQEDFDRLPEKPSDEELDMLDLAYELTDTSRLGCQIILTKELNGLEVRVPTNINDARS